MTYDWWIKHCLRFNVLQSCIQGCYLFIYLFQLGFILGARNFHFRRIEYEKSAPKTGTRKWSRFMDGAPETGDMNRLQK